MIFSETGFHPQIKSEDGHFRDHALRRDIFKDAALGFNREQPGHHRTDNRYGGEHEKHRAEAGADNGADDAAGGGRQSLAGDAAL